MAELTLRQSMILSRGDPAVLLHHPIAILFLGLTVFSIWRFAIAGARSMQVGPQKSAQETKP
jgi:putative tricarboxylic transport membrane protein